ncbi:MAG: type II toxin-antitoxin system RelE/ParE family toxin [Flavobacteriaceae bacterium]|nr:type II toxin-antitoxin system RelE/ParE family toxin [Flavobacteriaceae bacterium]
MVNVNWTKRALKDIDHIADYIAKDSVHYAKIQVRRFLDKVEILKLFPNIGRIVPEKGQSDIREINLGNYRIIYRIEYINSTS